MAHKSETERRLRDAWLGFVTLMAILFLLSYSQRPRASMEGIELRASFEDVTGIRAGSEVRLGGVVVGAVQSLSMNKDGRAQVVMRVRDDIPIPRDSSVAVQKDGLFGATLLVIEAGGELDVLRDGAQFQYSESALTLDELLDAVIAQGEQRLKIGDE